MLVIKAHLRPISPIVPPLPIARDTVTGRAFLDRETLHVHDLLASERRVSSRSIDCPASRAIARLLAAPLMREERRSDARHSAHRGQAVQRQADRTAEDLCRPGCDRYRERQAVRRGAGKDARSRRIADLPEGDQRRARGDRQVGFDLAAGPRCHCRDRRRTVRGRRVGDKADEEWVAALRRIKQPHRPCESGTT